MNDYKFTPLPTAYPMNWCDLMLPVKEAVCDLLVRLKGAEESRMELKHLDKNKELGNCFLVYGERGTGKTTVLLSAQKAICKENSSSFFNNPINDKLEEITKKAADELKDIVWLDVLDLETLPEEANLLATLLIRVRNALNVNNDCKYTNDTLSSIFEEDANSARQQLSKLINDATMMWEDVHEQDTRSIANKQVAAAEIYAGFRKRFRDVMNKLSEDLGRRSGTHNEGRSIILPIDNIDRSTYHLEAIVKLAQMVSHHRLWLIMAGDRVEVETFLERAYWKELIHSKVGVDTRGKESAEGEDETLVMARRQAAATSRKLWPASHRIEIKFIKAKETLSFFPPNSQSNKTISELFAKVVIPYLKSDKKSNIRLLDLFDLTCKMQTWFSRTDFNNPTSLINKLIQNNYDLVRKYFSREGCDEALNNTPEHQIGFLVDNFNKIIIKEDLKELPFYKENKYRYDKITETDSITEGRKVKIINKAILEDLFPDEIKKHNPLSLYAKHSLCLPARGVLDLWQLAYWVVNDNNKFGAEKIARTMLRNAIASSEMQSTMAKCLQDNIICRTKDGGTNLHFGEDTAILSNYSGTCTFCEITADNISDDFKPLYRRFKVSVNYIENQILSLEKKVKYLIKGNYDEFKCYKSDLPDFVSGWLTILYDIISLEGSQFQINKAYLGSWIHYSRGQEEFGDYEFIKIDHEIIIEGDEIKSLSIIWPTPKWPIFWAHDLFRHYWHIFLNSNSESLGMRPPNKDLLLKLSTGWIDTILNTYVALNSSTLLSEKSCNHTDGESCQLNNWEGVIKKASEIYSSLVSAHETRKSSDDELGLALRKWMEEELPLFLSYLYVPSGKKAAQDRFDFIEKDEDFKKSALDKYWKRNHHFILNKMTKMIKKNLYPEVKDKENDKNTKVDEVCKDVTSILIGSLETNLTV